ncbi:DEAD/DEAH box helicase [Brucepastera parasyntrophica]|uniref:DEAD/DEAH box helicase n=1 Tax=Brucepastera parasyntrophica TaxID=2880008 RepID=UPI00210E0563|nr:DEAD/DEAH box helicase [Brucepastera parasyntrophica]ULQ59831.1 DEAD/DEAH box helicase [Brucepastera parasyntrophica]
MLPETLHPLVRTWFSETYGNPTEVQAQAWPLIAENRHVLALAPTGSGKTLAAFLVALSRFADGTYKPGVLSVLYISPLKALNEDIRRNLLEPLESLSGRFQEEGVFFPDIRVDTRSGDTTQTERRRFLSKPPGILALTPESLAILLLNPKSRTILSHLQYVVLDEIHSVLGTKRGSFLACQLARLSLVSGEFQRVALSATVNPPEAAARFAGGLKPSGSGNQGSYEPRNVCIVAPPSGKRIDFIIEYPSGTLPGPANSTEIQKEYDSASYHTHKTGNSYTSPGGRPDQENTDTEESSGHNKAKYDEPSYYTHDIENIYTNDKDGYDDSSYHEHKDAGEHVQSGQQSDAAGERKEKNGKKVKTVNVRYGARYIALIDIIAGRIQKNRTTLVFTDARRRAERIAFLLNERFGETVAFAHHGSLSKEVRRAVEIRLAEGRLPCVVATGSLELGIDIGSVDEVILAGSPNSSSVALQRIGRSGHGVGKTSYGRLVPFHGNDLLTGVALAGAIRDREIEKTAVIENPLDILAQIILALCTEAPRNADELYNLLRGFLPFENLGRPAYDRVVQMLAGRYSSSRLRDLKPRLYIDAKTGLLTASDGVLLSLYSSGGVIANRGSYSLRLPNGTKIGELDEEFVWERRTGDSFSFGTHSWRIVAIGSEAVEVVSLERPADFVPFWRAEAVYRSPVLVERMLKILDSARNGIYSGEAFADSALTEDTLFSLKRFLEAQKDIQNVPLSGRDSLAIEIIEDALNKGDMISVVLHTFRGGAVNYPLSMALAGQLEESLNLRVETIPDDNAILVILPRLQEISAEQAVRNALQKIGDSNIRQKQFYARFESSGVFGAAFREAAERSMLLPKAGFGRRTPLWIMRQRAKRLFDAVSGYGDFPAIAEAWRSCLTDQFDMNGFNDFCSEIADGSVSVHFFNTREPSPFALDMVWKETNKLLYDTDDRPELRGSSLSDQVINDAIGNARLRPAIPASIVSDFTARLRRELPDWSPETVLELSEWVKERIAIPADEWKELLENTDPGLAEIWEADHSLSGNLVETTRKGSSIPSIIHIERADIWQEEPLAFLDEWLRYEGPVFISHIAQIFGVTEAEAEDAASALEENGDLVRNVQVSADSAKKTGEESFSAGELVCDRENLELLLRLSRKRARPDIQPRPASLLPVYLALRQGILQHTDKPWEKLSCVSAPARLWETDFFPARLPSYRPELLDAELHSGNLVWFGTGEVRAGFCSPEDLDLVLPERPGGPDYFADSSRPRDFWELKDDSGLDISGTTDEIWKEAWAGRLTADTWEPVRKGLVAGFAADSHPETAGEAPYIPGKRRNVPRALRDRWKAGKPVEGKWFSLATDGLQASSFDPLDEEELERDRVRLLIRRWGILCRPFLEREEPALSWGKLIPVMRRLELSGELVAGRFFDGINSLQFAHPGIAEELTACDSEKRIFWINACDPANPAGMAEGLDENLPSRLAANRLCFRGPELAAVSTRNGKELRVFVSPEDIEIKEILSFLRVPRTRTVYPERKVLIETVNGEPAADNPYTRVLQGLGFEISRDRLILW